MNQKLIDWSQSQFSDLPWRTNRSLYGTLVSEIMLQQTTVGTVVKHFERFLKQFPDINSLASASEDDVLLAWQGLGYYRRARSLHSAAKEIKKNFKGQIPLDYDVLITIKGIGPYTASALRSIGSNQTDLAVDANLERVLARFYALEVKKGPKLQKKIRELFLERKIVSNINELGPRKLNEALMDLGRRVCQARSAACEICPLKEECQGRMNPLKYPLVVSENQQSESFELHLLRCIIFKDDKILVYKKSKDEWLSGQYEIPTFNMWGQDEKLSQYPNIEFQYYDLLPSLKSGITKYKITNFVIWLDLNEFNKLAGKDNHYQWANLAQIHLSHTSLKCLSLLDK